MTFGDTDCKSSQNNQGHIANPCARDKALNVTLMILRIIVLINTQENDRKRNVAVNKLYSSF